MFQTVQGRYCPFSPFRIFFSASSSDKKSSSRHGRQTGYHVECIMYNFCASLKSQIQYRIECALSEFLFSVVPDTPLVTHAPFFPRHIPTDNRSYVTRSPVVLSKHNGRLKHGPGVALVLNPSSDTSELRSAVFSRGKSWAKQSCMKRTMECRRLMGFAWFSVALV